MRRVAFGVSLLACLALPSQAQPEHKEWNVRVFRMEGAAVSIREAADTLFTISMDGGQSGRAQQAARIRSATDTLHKKVVSATLAAQVLDEGIPGSQTP